jgi:hypothetical protein
MVEMRAGDRPVARMPRLNTPPTTSEVFFSRQSGISSASAVRSSVCSGPRAEYSRAALAQDVETHLHLVDAEP